MDIKNSELNVIGLVASRRKLGNSEVLVKEALLRARKKGANTSLLRLTDFNFEYCHGCLKCLFLSQKCAIKDDLEFLFSQIVKSDGIIIGAPTYGLFPSAVIKLIQDRSGSFFARNHMLQQQKAGIISVAGRKDLDTFTIPVLSTFLYSLNMKKLDIIRSISIYSPGPSQSLLDPYNVDRAGKLGQDIVEALNGKRIAEGRKNHCPICQANFFHIEAQKVTCPICATKGTMQQESIEWDNESLKNHRYTSEQSEKFVNEWIRESKTVFRKHATEVIELRSKYRNSHLGMSFIKKE